MIEDFLSDRLDICILALPEDNEFSVLEDEKIIKIPFGYKSSVVVVNAENPISEITINQLAVCLVIQVPSSNLLELEGFWNVFFLNQFYQSLCD